MWPTAHTMMPIAKPCASAMPSGPLPLDCMKRSAQMAPAPKKTSGKAPKNSATSFCDVLYTRVSRRKGTTGLDSSKTNDVEKQGIMIQWQCFARGIRSRTINLHRDRRGFPQREKAGACSRSCGVGHYDRKKRQPNLLGVGKLPHSKKSAAGGDGSVH